MSDTSPADRPPATQLRAAVTLGGAKIRRIFRHQEQVAAKSREAFVRRRSLQLQGLGISPPTAWARACEEWDGAWVAERRAA